MPSTVLEAIFREQAGRVLATLIRLLGDLDLAEDSRQDAFAAAAAQWPEEGIPANPLAWLIKVGHHKALDQLRRRALNREKLTIYGDADAVELPPEFDEPDEAVFGDDRLRLIFTCCHPALNIEARVALTLRAVCGLSTPEIARAFLVSEDSMAQRLVRAQRKIR